MHEAQRSFPFLHQLADAASEVILPIFRSDMTVAEKQSTHGFYDPVTEADRGAEKVMRTLINDHHPDHGILGEEFGAENLDAEYVWVLDPIDGTRAFISGLPLWGVLIGLRHQGRPACGMVAQPYLGERFFGDETGAFLTRGGETREISTRACASIAEMTISTTTPELFDPAELECLRRVEGDARMTRYGYDCYAYVMVAMGFIDCVIETQLQPYDIEAIIPIIESAGGRVTDWQGNAYSGSGQVLAVGDERLQEPVIRRLEGNEL